MKTKIILASLVAVTIFSACKKESSLPNTNPTATLTALNCSDAADKGILSLGVNASDVSTDVPYTGGNGGTYAAQSISSSGVTGLKATLVKGTLATGNGSLTYTITGTPATSGIASFELNIGGKTCTLTRTVKDPQAFDLSINEKIVTVKNLPADTIIGTDGIGRPIGSGKYTFFSLETNSWIPNSDSATAKWDLAFAGTTIRVNNVTSGPGKGGAYIYTGTFESLLSVPTDAVFAVDNHPVSYAIPKGSGIGWYNYDGPANLVTAIPGKVLVIKTANEKYAKIEILNYYRGGVTPSVSASPEIKSKEQRFYTFRYTYQPDGSTNF